MDAGAFVVSRARLAVAALLLAAVAAALFFGVRGGGSGAPPQDAITGGARLSTSGALFGDRILAQIRILVDPRRIDPKQVAFRATFSPYTYAQQPTVTLRRLGNVTRVVYSVQIVCFTQECVPPLGGSKQLQFPPAQISFRTRAGARHVLLGDWGPLTVAARTSAADFAGYDTFKRPPWRVTLDPVPPTYSVSPHALRLVLFLVSGLLAAAALAALAQFLLSGRGLRRTLLTPLERALVLVEHAAARSDPEERRKALARLSEELARSGEPHLSHAARELAWAEPAPVPVATEPLTIDVRRVIDERSNGHGR